MEAEVKYEVRNEAANEAMELAEQKSVSLFPGDQAIVSEVQFKQQLNSFSAAMQLIVRRLPATWGVVDGWLAGVVTAEEGMQALAGMLPQVVGEGATVPRRGSG